MIFFALFMIGLAAFPTYLAWRDWRAWYYLRREGAETDASVQYHWVGRLGMFDHYYVIYEFDGTTPQGDYFFYSKHTEISREGYMGVLDGVPLRVRYAVSRPGIFRLASQPTEQWSWTFKALFTWACTLVFLLIGLS